MVGGRACPTKLRNRARTGREHCHNLRGNSMIADYGYYGPYPTA
jgi:hypothetical protein